MDRPFANTQSSAAARRTEARQLLVIAESDEHSPMAPASSLPKPGSSSASASSKAEVYSALKRRAEHAAQEDPDLEKWVKAQSAKYK